MTTMNESERQEFLTDLRESLKLEAEVCDGFDELLSNRDPYDPVDRPSHYVKNGLESIAVIEAFTPDPYSAYMANVIKYVLRHMDKGKPKQDLEKARFYLNKMIEDWDD